MFKNYINELKKTKTYSEWVKIKTHVLSICIMCFVILLSATITCIGEIIHLCSLSVIGGVFCIISFGVLFSFCSDLYEEVL